MALAYRDELCAVCESAPCLQAGRWTMGESWLSSRLSSQGESLLEVVLRLPLRLRLLLPLKDPSQVPAPRSCICFPFSFSFFSSLCILLCLYLCRYIIIKDSLSLPIHSSVLTRNGPFQATNAPASAFASVAFQRAHAGQTGVGIAESGMVSARKASRQPSARR